MTTTLEKTSDVTELAKRRDVQRKARFAALLRAEKTPAEAAELLDVGTMLGLTPDQIKAHERAVQKERKLSKHAEGDDERVNAANRALSNAYTQAKAKLVAELGKLAEHLTPEKLYKILVPYCSTDQQYDLNAVMVPLRQLYEMPQQAEDGNRANRIELDKIRDSFPLAFRDETE